MHKILVWTNPKRDFGLQQTARLAEILKQFGYQVIMDADATPQGLPGIALYDDAFSADPEAVFVLGGDGTVLGAVRKMAGRIVPVLGINLGRLGFLSEVEPAGLGKAVECYSRGDYDLETRMMLSAQVENKPLVAALNDVVVTRANTHMIDLEISISTQVLNRFLADGLVLATPTGSTAYALAAGGPVLAPNMGGMVMVPICPHSLHVRPVVLGQEETVTLRCIQGEAAVAVDGIHLATLKTGQSVIVRKAQSQVAFIRFGEQAFYERLMKKLTEWAAPVADF